MAGTFLPDTVNDAHVEFIPLVAAGFLLLLVGIFFTRKSVVMEWFKAIYSAVGAEYPILTQIMAVMIGGFIFGGAWWVIGHEYRKDHPDTGPQIANTDTPTLQPGPETKQEFPLINPPKPSVTPKPISPVATVPNIDRSNTGQFWKSVKDYNETSGVKKIAEIDQKLRGAMDHILAVREAIRSSYSPEYSTIQTNFNCDPNKGTVENDLSFVKVGYQQPKVWTRYSVELIGNELVFQVIYDGKAAIFYRTSIDTPNYGDDFEEGVKQSIIPQMTAEVQRND